MNRSIARHILLTLLVLAALALSMVLVVAIQRFYGYEPFRPHSVQEDGCPPVARKSSYVSVFGMARVFHLPAPVGTVIEARSPTGEVVGCTVVQSAGEYGPMPVYGSDAPSPQASYVFRSGEAVTFYVDGMLTIAPQTLMSPGDRDAFQANLEVVLGGMKTWHLAEGYAAEGYLNYMRILNLSTSTTTVTLTYQFDDGSNLAQTASIPQMSSSMISMQPGGDETGSGRSFSVVVEATAPVVAARVTYTNDIMDGYEAAGTAQLSRTWYFAEGCTKSDFKTFFAIQNPNPLDATIRITYFREDGAHLVREQVIPARSRGTLSAHASDQVGAGWAFSTLIESSVQVAAERITYWNGMRGVSGSVGTREPATRWYLAEGDTTAGRQTILAILNPGSLPAQVTLTYQREDSTDVVRSHVVPGKSRYTVFTESAAQVGSGYRFATKVMSTQPIVVDRVTYWNGGQEGHSSAGHTSPGKLWVVMEGGMPKDFDTYLLIQNPTDSLARVKITYMRDDGLVMTRLHRIGPQRRYTVRFADDAEEAAATGFVAILQSNAPIVVDKSTYWADGQVGLSSGGVQVHP